MVCGTTNYFAAALSFIFTSTVVTAKFIKNSILYLFAKTAFLFALLLPRAAGLRLFGAAGRLAFLFPNREKRRTLEHLRCIFGATWTEDKISVTAKNVYESLGRNLFDAVKISRASEKTFHAIVKHDDLAEFKSAFDRGKGVIVITAHVGCFELLLHFFARHGFKSFAIGQRSFDQRLDSLIRAIRSGEDIDYMDRTESPRKIIRWLREGRAFGVLIDQDTRVEGVFARFLGKIAYTPSGPVRMAMRFKIPAIVATTARQPDNTHYVYLSRILEFADTGDFEKDLAANVQMANDLICETIMRFPEQWVWMHRRWKTRPPPISLKA
jgi:KDO2-lipid IV(A) lauroyltransferase